MLLKSLSSYVLVKKNSLKKYRKQVVISDVSSHEAPDDPNYNETKVFIRNISDIQHIRLATYFLTNDERGSPNSNRIFNLYFNPNEEEKADEEIKVELDWLSELFSKKQKSMIDFIMAIFPEAITKLNSAYERLSQDDPEAYSHALISCRRLLKDLANLIYSPQKELIHGRKVTEDKYIRRFYLFQ